MPSNIETAKSAIQIALKELRLGKKQAARAWAQRAIALAPEQEDPWLILAAVAEPRASLEYLKEALKINPGSQRARQGLLEVQRRLERTTRAALVARQDSIEARQPPEKANPSDRTARQDVFLSRRRSARTSQAILPQPTRLNSTKKTSRFPLKWLGLFFGFGLGIIAIVVLTFVVSQSRIVEASGVSSSASNTIVLQSMATSTPTVTETPQPTETPLPTDTLPPTPSDTPKPPATSTLPPAPSLTAVPVANNSPVLPPLAANEKRIIVYISQQHLYAYQGDTLVYSFVASTGASNSTRIGTFSILDKMPNAWSDPWGFWMPDWMGIYWIGYTENGIHALPVLTNGNVIWGNGLGTPISHGCVVLSTEDARLLFRWADIGTQVQILR